MTCVSRGLYAESDDFYILFLHIASVFQVPINLLGFYLIINKTPSKMEGVKYAMLLLHSTCTFMDVSLNVLVMPYVVFPAASAYGTGLLVWFGIYYPPMQAYIAFCPIMSLAAALVVFFEDRYNRLVRHDANTRERSIKRIVSHGINYFLVLFGTAFILMDIPDQEEAKKRDMLEFPCLPPKFTEQPGYFKLASSLVYIVLPLAFILFISMVQCFYYVIGTALELFRTKAQSKRTSDMQKKFFFSLCLQVAVPSVVIVTPCIYIQITASIGYLDLLFANITMFMITLHGLVSTITMIVIHKPYRLAALSLFRIRRSVPVTPMLVARSVDSK